MTDESGDLAARASALEQFWCAAVDGQDLESIQGLFAPGGTFTTRGQLMGHAERAAFFPGVWTDAPSRSTHVCRDVRATPTAAGIAISARLAATFVLPDGSIRIVWGRYDDLAVQTQDGLRLLDKKVTLDRTEYFTEDRHGVRPELDHVALALGEGQLAQLIALFIDGLGGTLISGGLEPNSGSRSAHVTFPGGGKIELLEGVAAGPVREFVATRGAGMHHVTVLVDDVDEVAAKITAAGFRVVGRSDPTPMWHEAYVHPHDAGGCLVQFVRSGAGYGEPVQITAEEILADGWIWIDQVPRPVSD